MFLGCRSLYVGPITNRVSLQPLVRRAYQISRALNLHSAEATNNRAPRNEPPTYRSRAVQTGKTLPARLSFATFLHCRPSEHLGQPRGNNSDSQVSVDTRLLGGTAVRNAKSILAHHFDNEADRVTALLSVVTHPKQAIRGSNTVDTMILCILEHYGEVAVPRPLLEAVILLVSQSLRFPNGQKTFNRIYPSLVHHIEHLPKPQPTRQPSNFVRSIFQLLHTLAQSLPEQSCNIYRLLVDKQYIPFAQLRVEDFAEGISRNFFYVSCIRACCHWKWTNLASTFLQDTIGDGELPTPIVAQLIQDILDLRLESPTREDVLASIQLIIRAHSVKPVTEDTISKVYASAARWDMGNEAKVLYTFTRQSHIIQEHSYPPPTGSTIFWFATYLANQADKQVLKDFLEEVDLKNVVVPPLDRAPLIELVVRNSYGQLAKAFWVKYSRGRHGSFVRDNPALMLNMVKYFSRAVDQPQKRPLNDTEGAPTRGNDDPKIFAGHILDVCRKANQPLASAPSFNLTSMAKAFSLLGQVDESLLTCIERKRHIGGIEMVDRNVFFIYLAQRNPSRALRELEKSIKSGAQVSFGSFTAIMHCAMYLDRFGVVKQAAFRLNELQSRSPHPSWAIFGPIEPLARAAHRDKPGSPAKVHRRFQTILDVISIMQYSPQALALNLDTGKLLINTSLSHCPELAYEFWKLFMKDLVRWEDQDHCSTRRRIGEAIISSTRVGQKRKKKILTELHG